MPLQNIVFDCGGVLFDKSGWRAAKYVGLGNLLFYILSCNSPLQLRSRFFSLLHAVHSDTDSQAVETVREESSNLSAPLSPGDTIFDGYIEPTSYEGEKLPQLMCEHMVGRKQHAEILGLIEEFQRATNAPHADLFYRMSECAFDPLLLTHIMKPVTQGHALASHVNKLRETHPERSIRIFMITNYNAAAFDVLRSSYRDTFSMFDDILVSGDKEVAVMKPSPTIFSMAISRFGIRPEDSLFIDDSPENVQAARDAGFRARLFQRHRTRAIWSDLDELVLSS